MAGYSATPLAKKLGIKAGHRVMILGKAVAGDTPVDELLGELPEGSRLMRRARNTVQIVIVYCHSESELSQGFARAQSLIDSSGAIWLAWPKKSARLDCPLDFNRVQRHGLAMGLVDNKVCAISEIYSGLRFVYRLKDR